MESIDFGLFTLRLLVGGIFIGHGLIKFTERFGGLGLARAGAVFEQIGYRPARPFLIGAGLTELAAGSAFVAGHWRPRPWWGSWSTPSDRPRPVMVPGTSMAAGSTT